MPTSPPTSPVDICNLVLDACGEAGRCQSIEAPTNSIEQTMSRWYDQGRRTVLREYVWNFAQKYTTINRTGDGNANFNDAYQMPNDLVRLNSIGQDRYHPVLEYEIFGREIHASEGTTLNIWYNRDVIEVSQMDALFINILVLRLALKLAYKLAKSKQLTESLSKQLALEEGKAISVDGQERPPRRIQRSRYLSARRSSAVLGRDNRYYELE